MSKKLKRVFDIIFSILLIIPLIPIWIIIAILSIISNFDLNFLYSDTRVFENQKKFKTLKFRTMQKNANQKINIDKESRKGNFYKNTPLTSNLFTPFGKFLERFQLNETLQILLILNGNMSFVGNRPLPLNIYENLLLNFKNANKIYDAPAGLTGASQIIGKHNLSTEKRINIEILYCKLYQTNKKLILIDIIIILLTIKVIITNKYVSYDLVKKLLSE